MSAGRLFAVVGPSGAGKDTLMADAAARRPGIVLARRVITRPSDAGGEVFDGVSEAEFAARRDRGEFAFWWAAHGLHYGIPGSIDVALGAGRIVLFNASRAMLGDAGRRYPGLAVVHVTAPRDVRGARLAARGREDADTIAARLARFDFTLPEGLPVHEIVNDGPVETGVARLLSVVQPERA